MSDAEASRLGLFAREFARGPVALIAFAVLLTLCVAAAFAPALAPQDPYDLAALSFLDARLPPGRVGSGGWTHWLGTDAQGRDLFSAVLHGLRISLGIGLIAGGLAFAIGTTIGILAALAGGRIEAPVMRLVDLQLSFPTILLAMVLVVAMGPGLVQVVVALIAAQWAYFARTAYGAAVAERGRDYIAAASGLALRRWRVAWRHLLPNCLPPLVVVAAVQAANAITLEATLSFLGLGAPVNQPSLGLLVANGFQYIFSGRYWISLAPGGALLVVVMAINLVADQCRDVLNPREER